MNAVYDNLADLDRMRDKLRDHRRRVAEAWNMTPRWDGAMRLKIIEIEREIVDWTSKIDAIEAKIDVGFR